MLMLIMKDEKEALWIAKLLKSKFIKRIFGGSVGGCISDFEKAVGTYENDKEFRKWMNKLIEEGDIEFYERKNWEICGLLCWY